MNNPRKHLPLACSVLLALGLAGCGTMSDHERTVEIGANFTTVGTSLGALKTQVDASLKALNVLSDRDEVASAFGIIKTAAADLGPAIDAIKATLASAEQEGRIHFDGWSRQNAAIPDGALRARGVERQTELASLMSTSATKATKAVDFGSKYTQSLKDLQQYLTNDLSPTAIGNAADLIAGIRADGERFRTALDSAIKDTTHFVNKVDG